jgi:hypothetical protein
MFHLCFRRMLQVFYLDVAYVSHICCKCFMWMLYMFHIYVANISSGCCICFAMATHMFSWRMLQVFQLLLDVCCKCVSSRCYKSRSGVAHVVVGPICRSHTYCSCWARAACVSVWRGREWQAWETIWAQIEDAALCGRADAGNRAAQAPTWSKHAGRCSLPTWGRGQAQQACTPDASPRPDIRALAWPISKCWIIFLSWSQNG